MSTPIECKYSVVGNGPPLFLIHGIGASRDAWRFVVPKISSNFTVITYDLRGHGRSPKTLTKFLLDDLVEDLEYLRKKLNFNKAYFAGHSLGGMIAPAYALKYPRHVLALGLFSTAAGRTKDDRAKILAVIKSMEKQGVSAVLPTLIDRWFTDSFISSSPDIIERRIQQVINTDPEIFMNVFRIYANTEMGPWLHKIKFPTLVLTGEKDGGCNPKLNKFIADQIPNSKLVILPNYKHSLLIETPNEIAENIINFFN
jgi:pimeloyl-ACP methyl ester carboxylesterase